MKIIRLLLTFVVLTWGSYLLANQPAYNEMFNKYTKLNSTVIKKTTSTPFNMDCKGTGANKNGFCEIDMGDAVYFGDTKKSQPHGNGIYYWKQSDTTYIGQFKNGKIDGLGVYVWDDGTYFQGKINLQHSKSSGVIFSFDKRRPAIYVGDLDSKRIYSRIGYGNQSYFEPGTEPTLNSTPVVMYEAYFENNVADGTCYKHVGEDFFAGTCNGSSPSEYNFRENTIRNQLFERNIDKAINEAAINFDKAGSLANKTYEIAFGEKIVQDQKKIIVEKEKKIELIPIEKEYVTLVNANVREKPKAGSKIVRTIPAESSVFVSGKVIGTEWFSIEVNSKFIGYSFSELYEEKEKWLARKKEPIGPIDGDNPEPEKPDFYGSGTGFFVTETGYIVTNHHVTHGCEYMLINDEKLKVLRNDVVNDLAVLKSKNKTSNYLHLSGKVTPRKGEDIFVIGYPFGKHASTESKVTRGIVSSLQGMGNNINQFQLDAAIQPGNSGGPVVNSSGSLLGVTVATADWEFYQENFKALPQNVNFAIKSSLLENFLASYNIKYEIGDNLSELNQPDMIAAVDAATVYMECWSTVERIEAAERGVNVLVDTVRAEKKKGN